MVLYLRVSTEEQAESRLGLDAQRAELQRAAEFKGWSVLEVISDEAVSGKDLERPGLWRALEMIASGDADGLAVSKLDRLSRSVIDAGMLADWFEQADATLIALDLSIDTSTPSGRMVFSIISAMAQWERETIAQRTRDGLAQLRAQGRPTGRPAVADSPELAERIRGLRADDWTFQQIADQLNQDGIPTVRGGTHWRSSSVQSAAGYRRPAGRHKTAVLPKLHRRGGR